MKPVMNEYRFKNLNIKHEGIEFLVNGQATYVIEDYDEDGKQACFDEAVLFDALGREGYVSSAEVLRHLANTAIIALHQDSHLCRVLGNKL